MQSEQPSGLPGFASLEFILIKRVLINVRPDLCVAEPQSLFECESQLSEAQADGGWRDRHTSISLTTFAEREVVWPQIII